MVEPWVNNMAAEMAERIFADAGYGLTADSHQAAVEFATALIEENFQAIVEQRYLAERDWDGVRRLMKSVGLRGFLTAILRIGGDEPELRKRMEATLW